MYFLKKRKIHDQSVFFKLKKNSKKDFYRQNMINRTLKDPNEQIKNGLSSLEMLLKYLKKEKQKNDDKMKNGLIKNKKTDL